MALPRSFLDELLARSDTVEIIGSYLPLKRQGRTYKAVCPFHNEKTASFTVYPDTQSFYCFGCNTGGDVITFVMKRDGLAYVEAVRFLSQRAGLAMPEDMDDSSMRIRRRIYEANKKAARFFFDTLNSESGSEVRAYLRRRGLGDSVIARFGLGYAPKEWDGLRRHMRSKGFGDDELTAAGLLGKGKKGVFDIFRGRVMFPIIDVRSNVVAFGGRTLGDGPKYLNTSDTEVFKKSRNLFALNAAKNSPGRTVILAEGYMDVVALHQAGFTGSVATLGTALTSEQARMLSSYADEIVIAYDSDEAGQRATRRAIGILREAGLPARVLNMSGAKDPDEFIKNFGAERFKMLLDASSASVEYELAKAKEKYPVSSDEGRVRYLAEASAIIARAGSPTERDVYASRVAEEMKVSKTAVVAQIEDISRAGRRKKERESERALSDVSAQYNVMPSERGEIGVAASERRLLALLFLNPDMLGRVSGKLGESDFYSKEVFEVYTVLKDSIESGEFSGFGSLSGLLSDSGTSLLAGLVAQNVPVNFTGADADYLTERMRKIKNRPDSASIGRMRADEIQSMIDGHRKI